MILFLNDWKKYPTAIVHVNTPNKHFLRLANLYRDMGIVNHAFHLALLQPELEFVDPHDVEKLDIDTMTKILYEVKNNPWYFFREIAKAPPLAGTEGLPFKANRANIALYWSFFNHITSILIQPRQTGKSFSTDMLMVYLLNYGTVNTHINMLTRSDDLRSQNLDRIKKIQEELPVYLNFKSREDIFNTEEIQLKQLGNMYKGNLSNMSPKLANNVGRGFTSPILHVDEACFIPNISIALSAALMAGNAARESAKENNKPYGTILTTTTGNLEDRDSSYIYKLWNSATVWNENFFDLENNASLVDFVYKNSRAASNETKKAIVNITMSYRQLGYSDEWMREKLSETIADGESADRDLFNRWTAGTSSSPIAKEHIECIKNSIVENPRIEIYKPYGYILNWYISEETIERYKAQGISFIAGIDTSEGIGRDDIAMVVRDSSSGEVICTAVFNELNLISLADFFVSFLLTHENLVMIIERRSSASVIIDYIIQKLIVHQINPFRRLFSMVIQEREKNEDMFKQLERASYYNEELFTKLRKYIGFSTSGSGITSRSELYSTTLNHMLKYTSSSLYDSKLSHQILGLVIKNGRIDHSEGGNDDLVIASLLSYWLLLNGKNLYYYNINTQLLLKSNRVYLNEKYSDSYYEESELKEKEDELIQLLEDYKKERDDIVSTQLENKIRYITNDLVLNFNKNISVEHMVDDIKREKRIQRSFRRQLY